jgi:hypothetical protein
VQRGHQLFELLVVRRAPPLCVAAAGAEEARQGCGPLLPLALQLVLAALRARLGLHLGWREEAGP